MAFRYLGIDISLRLSELFLGLDNPFKNSSSLSDKILMSRKKCSLGSFKSLEGEIEDLITISSSLSSAVGMLGVSWNE